MFEKASRLKLRFVSVQGALTVEDLWDLPLKSVKGASLDNVAKSINRQLKEVGEESFVDTKSSANKELELMLDIAKHIIRVRLEENEAARNKVANAAKRQKILAAIETKEDAELVNTDIDDLRKMAEEL